ncbi:hypothetical protein BRD00_05815 [Halobacteriales archaeon QS_8_69_26]|nr:MAG: hypothetical protein BRD00_05815 [Halobacteriales archaeon QS_8_69_26]
MSQLEQSRREVLALGVTATGSAILSGCLGNVGGDGTTAETNGPTSTGAATTGTEGETGTTTPTPTAAVGTWPTLRGNVARAGADPDAAGPAENLTKDWQSEVETGYRPRVTTSLAVADGSVYFGWTNTENYTGGTVASVSAADGSVEWEAKVGGFVSDSLTVRDGRVYGTAELDDEVKVVAISAADGTKQWERSLPAPYVQGAIATAPTVTSDGVYVGNIDGVLYGFAPEDGSDRWRYESPDGHSFVTPAVVDGTVVAGTALDSGFGADPLVVGLSGADGSELWRYEANGGYPDHPSVPAVSNGVAYVSGPESVHAVSVSDGSEQWSTELPGGGYDAPAASGDAVYVSGEEKTLGLSAADGSVQWQSEMSFWREANHARKGPILARETLYGPTFADGRKVLGLSAADGSKQWEFDPGDEVFEEFVVAGEAVFTASDNDVYSFSGTP